MPRSKKQRADKVDRFELIGSLQSIMRDESQRTADRLSAAKLLIDVDSKLSELDFSEKNTLKISFEGIDEDFLG